jgi:hypothetical protein
MAVHLDRRAVDVERHRAQTPATPVRPDPASGELQHRLAQDLEIVGLRHQRREAGQCRLRGQPRTLERRQTGRGTRRQAKRRIMAQRIGIIMIPPALRGQQHAGADQRGEIVGHIGLVARIVQPRGHPWNDPAGLQDLPQRHRAGIARQPVRPALDPQRPVEPRRDRL